MEVFFPYNIYNNFIISGKYFKIRETIETTKNAIKKKLKVKIKGTIIKFSFVDLQ